MHSLSTCCLFVPNIVMSPDAFWADWTGNPWLNPRCWRHLPEAANRQVIGCAIHMPFTI